MTVNAGILQLSGGSNSLGTNPNVTVTGGTLDLGGGTQNAGAITMSGSALNDGSVNFSQTTTISSGTINANLSNNGFTGVRAWWRQSQWRGRVGRQQHVYLHGWPQYDHRLRRRTGPAGTVMLASPAALGPGTQTTDVYSGTVDLNGQSGLTNGGIRLLSGSDSSLLNNNTSATASLPSSLTLTLGTTASGANVGGPGNIDVAGPVVGSGMLNKIGTGMLVLSGSNSYGGGTTVTAGTLQFGDGSSGGTLPGGDITSNGALVLNCGGSVLLSGAVNGTGDVRQLGSGTVVLAGNNGYTGNTFVNAGKLYLNGPSSTSTISVATGATLGGNGSATSGTATVAAGGSLDFSENTGSTFTVAGLTLSGRATIGVGNSGLYAASSFPVLSVANDGGLAVNSGPGSVSFALSGPPRQAAVRSNCFSTAEPSRAVAAPRPSRYSTAGLIGLGSRTRSR